MLNNQGDFMSYEAEISELTKRYHIKLEEYEKNEITTNSRDANGNAEHQIDLWYLREIEKLKKKYNLPIN